MDGVLYREDGVPDVVRDAFTEATRNGPHGLVEDWRLMATRSGLAYTAVTCPVRLWHGMADGIIPHHHAEYVAKLIPKAELELLAGVGHLHTAARWRDFVDAARDLSSDGRPH